MIRPYPLTFRGLLFEKTWGGRRLERLGKPLPSEARIGESWELADLDATSPGGAGGGAARPVISDGPLAGETLRDAIGRWGSDLIGSARLEANGSFPLLVKFLDAHEDLSVQVHPSPEYARAHPTAAVKDETWYVIHADPGALIYRGLRPETAVEQFRTDARAGRVVEHLATTAARPGDCHHLPSGTVHALGRGILLAEIQTPSDTTFRLWDWPDRYDRPGREIDLDAALECCIDGPPPAVTRNPEGESEWQLADAGRYDLWELRPTAGERVRHPRPTGSCTVLVVIEGALSWPSEGRGSTTSGAGPGATALIPPACRDTVRAAADARVLAVALK